MNMLRVSCCMAAMALALALCSCGGGDATIEAGQSYVLNVYWHRGMWAFNDIKAGIAKAPVTRDSGELIDRLVVGVPNASGGFRLVMSSRCSSTGDVEVVLLEEQDAFCRYRCESLGCTACFSGEALKGFEDSPSTFYLRAEPRR